MQFSTILVTLTCALTALASPTIMEKRQCDTSGCKSECEAAGYVSALIALALQL